jgi:hypothetical protein
LPKIRRGGSQCVAFEGLNRAGCRKLKEPEFTEVGNEDEPVLAQIAKGLWLGGERVEAIVGGLDLDNAALRVLEKFRLSAVTLALWLGEKASVGETRSAVAKLGREQDGGFERLTDCVEKSVEGRIVGCLGGRRAGRADGPEIGDVFGDSVSGRQDTFMIARAHG